MEWREVASRIEAGEDGNTEFKPDTFGFVLTEEQVIPSASIEDIAAGAFRSFLRAQGLDTGEEPQPPGGSHRGEDAGGDGSSIVG